MEDKLAELFREFGIRKVVQPAGQHFFQFGHDSDLFFRIR